METIDKESFKSINNGFNSVFRNNKLSIGLVIPLENYPRTPIPTMKNQMEKILLAEELNFKAIWLRDIPFNDPSFGDVGQMYDPFSYLGYLSAKTSKIALGVGSLILPLKHPANVAKAAASIDALSNGRLILGVASGDRAKEYPAMNIDYDNRGNNFRESFNYINQIWEDFPMFDNEFGSPNADLDMLPKPTNQKVPMLITGASQQNPSWLASNGDGWITYPRPVSTQKIIVNRIRDNAKENNTQNRPISQSLYIDLVEGLDFSPQPIHLGYRLNVKHLIEHLKSLEAIGINHVALNLRFNQADIEKTLKIIAAEILPEFS
ncbi:MAG: LLM class flavin-dependent oxidoreductase [Arcobacter sp.]|nr:LLM class flavin-dependent oxidoreductase [Arcobacter sp.]|tara:strand:- start:10610 stop:11572 length:963 start_codon:yes stop_codon:yes gene_type:complete